MGTFISLGKYNKNYKYILLYLVFRALNDCIYSLEYQGLYEEISFFGANDFFSEHELINQYYVLLFLDIYFLFIIN